MCGATRRQQYPICTELRWVYAYSAVVHVTGVLCAGQMEETVATSTNVAELAGATTPPTTTPPQGGREDGGGKQLVRVTVNLTKRSHDHLATLSESTKMGKTDVINRALQIYSLVHELMEEGGGRLEIRRSDGSYERIYIL